MELKWLAHVEIRTNNVYQLTYTNIPSQAWCQPTTTAGPHSESTERNETLIKFYFE